VIHRPALLLTPGPTPVPAEVAAAGAEPIPHHRTPAFAATFARVLAGLQRVYRTRNDVVVFASSGTMAMESAYANLLHPGARLLVVSAGSFGDRWVAMGRAYGADVEVLSYPWGTRPDPAEVSARIAGDGDLAMAVVVHSETSTGSLLDLQSVAEGCRERSAVLVVDAISSLGAAPLETDAWDLDVVVTGSQKALMCPPGLAFASVSARALARAEANPSARYTLDWRRSIDAQRRGDAPFTPAISLIRQLDVALAMIERDGLDDRIAETRALGRAIRRAATTLGLPVRSPDDDDCGLVTAIGWEPGLDGDGIRKRLRDDHGIVVAGGQGQWAGTVMRLGAFGAIDERALVAGIAALEVELIAAGHVVEPGSGVGAFLRSLGEARAR
jgi:aspartate aminotransferase-like enzyme